MRTLLRGKVFNVKVSDAEDARLRVVKLVGTAESRHQTRPGGSPGERTANAFLAVTPPVLALGLPPLLPS